MSWLLDALFPRFCLTCKTEGVLLCTQCHATWWHEPPEAHADHLACYAYANPVVRQLMCTWKYQYDHSAWDVLRDNAQPLLAPLQERVSVQKISAIVPLPLSAQRERERGFNQSMFIAQWLSKEFSLPVVPMLKRAQRSGHQADRSYAERERAMVNSPFVAQPIRRRPTSVLLVDDVWTTGSTIEAAKRALTSAGIQQILAFTLAKG